MTDFVTVEGRALAKAMKIANAVVEKRSTIPILSCVKLSYANAVLIVTGTDLDIELRIDVDVIDGGGDWSVCLNAKTLEQIASVADVAPMRFERTTREVPYRTAPDEPNASWQQDIIKIIVNDGTAIYDIDAPSPASDWPDIAAARGDLIERFTNGMFAACIKKVAWAISTEETRYYLNGVAWQQREDGRRFVATDGHRLASCRYTTENNATWSRIIPRKTVAFIDKFLRGCDVEVFATEKDTIIDILAPGLSVRTKLIDGTFPDVDRVMPKGSDFDFEIKAYEFTDAIKQATAIGGERSRGVRLMEDDGRMTIERKSPDFGAARVKTSTEWPSGAEAFGFNGRYISEIVASCIGTVKLGMTSAASPFLITDEDDTMTRVIMPMRTPS